MRFVMRFLLLAPVPMAVSCPVLLLGLLSVRDAIIATTVPLEAPQLAPLAKAYAKAWDRRLYRWDVWVLDSRCGLYSAWCYLSPLGRERVP